MSVPVFLPEYLWFYVWRWDVSLPAATQPRFLFMRAYLEYVPVLETTIFTKYCERTIVPSLQTIFTILIYTFTPNTITQNEILQHIETTRTIR